jgi:hypothetical protein
MNAKSIEQLINRVTEVSIGDGTDQPSVFEGYGGRDGMMNIREHILDEYSESTGEIEESEGTLLDVLQGACVEGGNFGRVTLGGLEPDEAAAVLNNSRYLEWAIEIATGDGDLNINGVDYELVDGKFVELVE